MQKMAQIPKIGSNSLSCKIWLYKVGLTPQNDHKTDLIQLFSDTCISQTTGSAPKCQKGPESQNQAKMGQNWSKIHNLRTAGDRKSVDPSK